MNRGRPIVDLTGKRFNKLLVIRKANRSDRARHVYWVCLCDCGKSTIVRGNGLLTRQHQSCGCLRSGEHRKQWVRKQRRDSKGYFLPKDYRPPIKPYSMIGSSLRRPAALSKISWTCAYSLDL